MKYDIVRSFLEKLLIFLLLSSFLGQYSLFFSGLAYKFSLLGNQRYISEVGTIDFNENPQTTSISRKNGFFQEKLKKNSKSPSLRECHQRDTEFDDRSAIFSIEIIWRHIRIHLNL